MKKLITLCFVFLLVMQNSYATTDNDALVDGIISGKVMDAALNEPLPYVNIIIKNHR